MFEPILNHLMDFDTKIIISASVQYIDNPPTIGVEYEPAIERGSFSQEVTGVVRKIAMNRSDGPVPHILIRSDLRKRLLELVPELRQGGEYHFEISQAHRARWDSNSANIALPGGYFDDVLSAIPHHPIWAELDYRARVDS